MTDLHSSPDIAEYSELADRYQEGLDKCLASGYEEFGPKFIREREMVIRALRAQATPSQCSAGSATVRQLDWLETFTDRGDGSQDHAGWEADSGFGAWYNVVAYFGSDSLGWEVSYDAVKIADHDDPGQAKKSAQAHFEKAVRAALQSPNVAQSMPEQVRDLATKLLDFIDNEGPCAKEWHPISETAGALRTALAISSTNCGGGK